MMRRLFLFPLALFGCGGPDFERVPPESTPSFESVDPAEVGLDSQRLETSIAELPRDHGLDALLVLRHDKLAFEHYFGSFDRDSLHDLRSATKSITALVTGISVERRELAVTDSVADHLAEQYGEIAPAFDAIRIEHLLTMTSGLACDDGDPSSPGQEDRMYEADDWVAFFLRVSKEFEPGRKTRYCTGGVIALGRVLELSTKTSFEVLAGERLFAPLHIEHFRSAKFDGGRGTDSGGHLRLRARDLLKIGEMLLGNGTFRGTPVLASDWILEATTKKTDYDEPHTDYGYLFWLDEIEALGKPRNVFFASGNGGQCLFVVPELDLAAVVLASNYNSPRSRLSFEWFAKGVVASVRE